MKMGQKKLCCICGAKATDKKTSSAFRKSAPLEKDFECCFGPGAEGRTGDICGCCRKHVQDYRNDQDKTFYSDLDSRRNRPVGRVVGKQTFNQHGHNYAQLEALPPPVPHYTSPRKRRVRDESPMPVRAVLRPKNDKETCLLVQLQPSHEHVSVHVEPPSKLLPPPTDGKPIHFLGHFLPNAVVSQILSYLPIADYHMMTFHFVIPALQQAISKLAQQQVRLTSVPEKGPLTQPQKRMLQKLITNRENEHDKDGCLVIPSVGAGKPKRLLKMPSVQKFSSEAVKRTKNQRSKILETAEKICSTPTIAKMCTTPTSSQELSLHAQRVNNIKRNQKEYASAAQEAGLKVVAQFCKDTVLKLRSIMTLSLWRLLKRVFTNEVGWDVFGSRDGMIKEQQKMEFDYECGTVTTSTGDIIHFVRVKDIRQVVTQLVNELHKVGQLIYLDNLKSEHLWLHVSADKGGKSSKLLLQVINQENRHSIYTAKLIAYFEGKDNRQNLEQVFGPLLKSLQDCVSNIAQLNLLRPCAMKSSICLSTENNNVKWAPLMPFDDTNTSVSPDCRECKKCRSQDKVTSTPDSMPGSDPCIQEVSTQHQPMNRVVQNGDTQVSPCSRPSSNQHHSTSTHSIDLSTPRRPPKSCIQDDQKPRNLFPISPSNDAEKPGQQQTNSAAIYTGCRLTVGGDWEGNSKLLGLSGPNGKYFCNHCMVLLTDVQKGKPHAVHILDKYQEHTNGHSLILPNDDDFLRTFSRCQTKNQEYKAAGEKAKAMNYESCEHAPLFYGDAIIDMFSTTPLHVSLGVGLHVLDSIEKEAVKLDRQVVNNEGQYQAFTSAFERKKEILDHVVTIKDKIEEVEDKVNQVVESKREIIRDRAKFFEKSNNGRFKNNSALAVGVRDRFDALTKEKVTLLTEKEKHEKILKKTETKLFKVQEELENLQGPFKCKLDSLLDSLKLQRCAYHSGALVGPDVKKLVTKKNIPKFGNVFNPIKLQTLNGEEATFGSISVKQKVITLLNKFKACYDLYTANRVLCKHEVEMLALRCSSFGCWYPVNFPDENLKRKFHLLTVDIPKQARRLHTVGMLTEQTIESIHPYINELDRRFAKVADKQRKGLIILKQQNMYSQPRWNSFKKR